jgi:cob(I)alamin adenosyltransferase
MTNKSSITTKVGDKGTTFLFSGEEVPKDSPRTEAYGDIDELVSVLGVARSLSVRPEIRDAILSLQRELFVAGSELATAIEHVHLLKQRIDARMLSAFDAQRDEWEQRIVMPTGFIIPGGTPAAAHIDQARSISRRAERKIVRLQRDGLVDNRTLLVWINRVSDFLWILARYEEGGATMLK